MSAAPRYYNARASAGPWDAIVIGSGIGGQTTAALLARCGKRVLVLEQHHTPGGFTHAFRRKGWSWDVGVHTVGDVSTKSFSGRLLALLTEGRLEWASLGSPYDRFYFPEGFEFAYPDHPAALRASLIDAFPGENAAIDGYFAEVRATARAMRGYALGRALPLPLRRLAEPVVARDAHARFNVTTASVLDRLTHDPRLRAALTAQWGYYAVPPSRSPFAMHALVTRHYWHGGYYPVGGAVSVATSLLSPVVAAGGAVRVNARVLEIVVENGRALGVRLDDGEEIRARTVISNAGARATIERLIPRANRPEAWARDLLAMAPSTAHVALYLGFKGDIRKVGATAANRWIYDSLEPDESVAREGSAPLDLSPLYVSFPSLKDPAHDAGEEVLHTGEVIAFASWSRFERWGSTEWMKRGADYEAEKAAITERLLDALDAHLPGLRPMIAHAELSTPLTTQHFAASSGGSIYGLEHTAERFVHAGLGPRTPVNGLYLAGADVASAGIMGASFGGVLAALAIDPIGVARVLARAR